MATITATLGPKMAAMSAAKSQKFGGVSLKSSRMNSGINSLASQFSGVKLSTAQITPVPISVPRRASLQIFASRVCPFTGKKSNKANRVSHSNHKTIRRQHVNLQYKKIWWEAGKRFVKLRLSTKAIKTIEKNGLDAMAKKAGIDLSKM